MSRTAIRIHLESTEQDLLQKILRKRSIPEFQKERIQIVLAAAEGLRNNAISERYQLEVHRIGIWRNRWAHARQQWEASDETLRPAMSEALVLEWLADKKGRGRKEDFSTDQRTKIAALCQESPEHHGFPVTHWSNDLLVEAAVLRGIVDGISRVTVWRILKKTTCRPTKADTG